MGKSRRKNKSAKQHDIRVQFLGIDDEVTGSATLLEVDGLKILLDLGMFQSQVHKIETIYKTNYKKLEIPYDELDYVIVSSAHADHCAGLGILGREDVNFKGVAICTELSQELIELNVRDSAFLMAKECEAYNKKNPNKPLLPLYEEADALNSLSFLRGYGYDQKIYLNDRVYIEFLSNGHLSGDGSVYLTFEKNEYEKKRVLYTGDYNYGKKKAFTKAWNRENLKVDLLLTEATYAGVIQPKGNPIDELEKTIMSECIQKKQVLIIPSFAIHRSTEIAYMLKEIYDRNEQIRKADISMYFAGVMMAKAHRIIGNPKFKSFYDEEWQDLDDVFNWDKFKFIERFQDVESKLIDNKCKIIVCSSGMLTGGYGSYIASMMMNRKTTSFLFTGYQGEGTLGRKVLDNTQKTISVNGIKKLLNAEVIGKIEGLSGHVSGEYILKFIKDLNQRTLKKIIIIHGNQDRKNALKEQLENFYKEDIEVHVPKVREIIKI